MFSFDFKSGDVGKFINDFKELNKSQQTALLTSGVFNAQQNQLLATSAGLTITESGQVVATTELAASQTAATASTTGLSAAMTGLGATIKSTLAALATNPVTWAVAGLAIAGVAAYNYAKALDNAIEKAEESQSAYSSTASELESLKSESESYKNTLNSLADTYEIKLTGDEEISELISKLQSTDISLEDRVQVDQIKSVNAELERQIALKQQLADKQSSQAVSDAIDALKIEHTQDLTQTYTSYDRNGIVGHEQNIQTDIITATQNEISALEELKKKRQDLFDDNIDDSKQTADFESLDADIKRYTDSISSNIENLTTLRENLMEDGVMKSGLNQEAQDYFHEITKTIDDFNNIDLSPAEKHLSQIESFFDGSLKSNSIKDNILNMLETGEVESATDAVHKLGLTLKELGITGKGRKVDFDDYFEGLINSAKEAENAINSIDGSVDGVKSAFETENKDADWNSMSDLLNQANELYKSGKVGTDDFKAAAQFISPKLIDPDSTKYDADAYVAAWEEAYDKVKRYFNPEKPAQSIANFTNDIVDKGLATKDGDDVTWKFKTSAEAAEALGLSVEATEVAMHNLEAYGAEFDEVMFSGEGLKRYESALDRIKSLHDSMKNGSDKERLGGLIENWDSEIQGYQNDLATLTEDKIIKIEFEYDLATIQNQIDELKDIQKAEGGKNAVTNASVISTNEKYISTAKEGLGLNKEELDLSVHFKPVDDAIEELYSELQNTESGSDKFFEIQAKIQNSQELQKELYNAFSSQHPEINADSNINEISNAWENFFNQEQHLSIDGELNVESIESQMKSLVNGSTISFTADLNGVSTQIQAIKNENGTIKYIATIDGEPTEVELNKDGSIKYDADMSKAKSAKAPDKSATVNYNAKFTAAKAPTLSGTVNYTARISGVGAGVDLLRRNGYSVLNGTAHKDGTLGALYPIPKLSGRALAMGTLEDNSWLNPKWKTQKDDVALTGEVGQEMVVHGNRWWTVGDNGAEFSSIPQGSVIFNAQQTKELLEKGFINSRGTAHLGGTAYANGFRLPTVISNSSKKSYSSSANKKSSSNKNNNSSSTASAVSKAAEDLKDFVEIYLNVASDLTQKQIDAIERAVGLADKQNQNAKAITNVQSEISKNQQAYNRYMQQANSVGLSESYASQIRNGSLNIENITDETLSKNIKSYEEW